MLFVRALQFLYDRSSQLLSPKKIYYIYLPPSLSGQQFYQFFCFPKNWLPKSSKATCGVAHLIYNTFQSLQTPCEMKKGKNTSYDHRLQNLWDEL